MYIHFLDNHQTINHQSIVYGIRELNSVEMKHFCLDKTSDKNPPMISDPYDFTSNYEVRVYQSGCFYLDSNNQWQSDGLLVGSLTTHDKTQCFSTHLTTFSSGIRFLAAPIALNDLKISSTNILMNKTSLQVIFVLKN